MAIIICEWAEVYGKWYFYPTGQDREIDIESISEIDENRIERVPTLTESELETIASKETGNEDDYKGFLRGYKFAKSGNKEH